MRDNTRCLECGTPIAQPPTGRPRIFCSGKCRAKDLRRRRRDELYERYEKNGARDVK